MESNAWHALKLFSLVFVTILPVINPVGSALIILGMTGSMPRQNRMLFSKHVVLCSFVLLAAFFLFGRLVLEFFGVTVEIVQVAGGIVLALMGWQLLNQKEVEIKSQEDTKIHQAPSSSSGIFYPYCFPVSIGPGCMAVAMTLSAHVPRSSLWEIGASDFWGLCGFAAACIVYYLCLAYLPVITSKLNSAYLLAVSKMIAFFVLCIGAQICWNGIQALK